MTLKGSKSVVGFAYADLDAKYCINLWVEFRASSLRIQPETGILPDGFVPALSTWGGTQPQNMSSSMVTRKTQTIFSKNYCMQLLLR